LEPATGEMDKDGSDDDEKDAEWADDRCTPAFSDE
jgi:hypothetical protein